MKEKVSAKIKVEQKETGKVKEFTLTLVAVSPSKNPWDIVNLEVNGRTVTSNMMGFDNRADAQAQVDWMAPQEQNMPWASECREIAEWYYGNSDGVRFAFWK